MDLADLTRRTDLPPDVERAVRDLVSEVQRVRQTQQGAADSGPPFRDVVEHANSVVLRLDLEGRVTYWNPFAERLFGFSREEITGQPVVGTIVPETDSSGRDLRALIEDLAAQPDAYASNENENLTRDGRRVWVAWTNHGEHDAEGNLLGAWCIGNDITQRKRLEEALCVERDFGSALAAVSDLHQGLRQWLEAGLRLTQAAAGAVHLLNPESGALALVAASGSSAAAVASASGLADASPCALAAVPTEPVYSCPSQAEPQPGERPPTQGGGTRACIPVLHEGAPVAVMVLVLPDRREVPPAERSALETVAAQMAGAVGRLQAEARVLELTGELGERAFELAATNQELEAFAYSVSHDLRAPLRAVDGFSQALLEDYDDRLDDTGRHYLERLRAGSQRMGRLIDDLLLLSRIGRQEMGCGPVDLTAEACKIAEHLQALAPEREVEFVAAEGLSVEGDVQLLRVALENLLGNAWKFTSGHPTARIELGTMESDGEPVYFVRDDGAGFDTAYAGKLFAPFQRLHTESEFEGTGIGLATVQRIIRRHGGRIWAEAEVEKGATVYFTIGREAHRPHGEE